MATLWTWARSTAKYLLVRGSIIGLRLITPFSFIYLGYCILSRPTSVPLIALSAYASCEAAFYLAVYLPFRRHLQAPAIHPRPFTRDERHSLFEKCSATATDHEAYIRGWFHYGDISDIRRDNLRDFLRWSLWHTNGTDGVDQKELDEYLERTEEKLGYQLEDGRGPAKCLRVTVDDVLPLHHPLLWYLIIGFLDIITAIRLRLHGFIFYRQPLRRTFSIFPFRLWTALARSKSPSQELTYFYRPHRSNTKPPIVYFHGIGIGLFPYVDLLAELAAAEPDVGIIAVEFMPISARLCPPQLLTAALRAEMNKILDFHGFDKFVLGANSFGTMVTSQLFHDSSFRARIASMVLVDPTSFMLHLPDVAYNVTARAPRKTSEWTLWYFASKDIGVAHTLHRRSFWTENIMWKEDLKGMDSTVVLAGQDIIVNTKEVKRYLFGHVNDSDLEGRGWKGEGLELLWISEADHADVFDYKGMRAKLVKTFNWYCRDAAA